MCVVATAGVAATAVPPMRRAEARAPAAPILVIRGGILMSLRMTRVDMILSIPNGRSFPGVHTVPAIAARATQRQKPFRKGLFALGKRRTHRTFAQARAVPGGALASRRGIRRAAVAPVSG
ncbi:hypothetical protein GCM10012285_25670 [Streptomyces kronopolitis]|uniref:Secreted protein n=1 Tax=Streptomyces kronopolitis TaxID=1612435 RepID=A0ABQ2JFD9_9ACTN|nr:hypothetical protein GCM10012285_25670 [Streptomyces kronopolitis]